MTNNQQNSKTQIILAVIGLFSALGVALIANWDSVIGSVIGNESKEIPEYLPGESLPLIQYLVNSGFEQKGFKSGVIIGQTAKGYSKDIILGIKEKKNIENRGIYTAPPKEGYASAIFQIPSGAKEFKEIISTKNKLDGWIKDQNFVYT